MGGQRWCWNPWSILKFRNVQMVWGWIFQSWCILSESWHSESVLFIKKDRLWLIYLICLCIFWNNFNMSHTCHILMVSLIIKTSWISDDFETSKLVLNLIPTALKHWDAAFYSSEQPSSTILNSTCLSAFLQISDWNWKNVPKNLLFST